MSYLGYFLAGMVTGAAVGFHIACISMKKLIKNEPEKFAEIFKVNKLARGQGTEEKK